MDVDAAVRNVAARHGGRSQRARAAKHIHDRGSSVLAERLVELWSWGLISAVLLQWLADAAVCDGLQHNDLVKLANLGAKGMHPGICFQIIVKRTPQEKKKIYEARQCSTRLDQVSWEVGQHLEGNGHSCILLTSWMCRCNSTLQGSANLHAE